jgi:membrane-associated phospholipid phosphatase
VNLWLFHAINDVHNQILDHFMLLGTQIGNYALFPIYLTVIVLAATFITSRATKIDPNQRQPLAISWLVTLSVLCVAYQLDGAFLTWAKHWLAFPRPLLALPQGTVHVIGEAEYYRSLPSGHASFAMVIAASLWPMLKRWQRWGATGFVVWVGVSRVNVGAHFPADVLAGWLTALPLVLLVRMIVGRWLSGLYQARWGSNA